MTRRTKIVATIGPASESPQMLRNLIRAGVDVMRLNLSHGTVEGHLQRLADVRAAADHVGRNVAVLADLPGPKIRSGPFPDGGIHLETGSEVRLVSGEGPSGDAVITVQYDDLLDDLRVGSRVQLGDGGISFRVTEIGPDEAITEVESGGRATGQPGVHLASDSMRLTTPTDEDLALAERMADAGVEFMAVSFVREAHDVDKVRTVVGTRAQLVAKVETSAALRNLEAIVAASDAVMVARGDLGIDCPIEDVPHLQKNIIRQCVETGVPVITATQMLESMIASPSPTRAEVSDVANAVFDGTDAVMLSGETAIGTDPVGVVQTMAAVAERAEREASYRQWASRLGRIQRELRTEGGDRYDAHERITMAITHAASEAAFDAEATAILCCTRTGRTARAMARFRPSALMIGLSPDPKMVRTMALSWGIEPVEVDTYESTDEMVWYAVETAIERGLIEQGDTVLVLAGAPRSARAGRPGQGQSSVASANQSSVATDVLRLVQVD